MVFHRLPLMQVVVMAVGEQGADRSLDEVYFFLGDGDLSGCVFKLECDEDSALASSTSKKIVFAGGEPGEANWRGSGEAEFSETKSTIRRTEGCSCLYGNPCIDSYVCGDWTNRFEVAKRNGFKG